MTKYRVEIDGETVWTGEGDGIKTIPAEYLERPADAADGDPHPPAHFLFETPDDGDEQLIGVQVSLAEEDPLAAAKAAAIAKVEAEFAAKGDQS